MADKLAYSVAEAAEVLGISRPTVYTLIHREDFPSFRIGNRTLISVSGLRHWVSAQSGGTEGGRTDGLCGQLCDVVYIDLEGMALGCNRCVTAAYVHDFAVSETERSTIY